MVKMTVGERRELIEDDDGDLDDDVYRPTDSGTQLGSYHGDPDCHRIRSSKVDTMDRREAQRRDKPPCKVCVLGMEVGGQRKDPDLGQMSRLEQMIQNGDVDDEHLGSPIGGD